MQFLRALRRFPGKHELWILLSLRHKSLIAEGWPPSFKFRFVPFRTVCARVLWQQTLLPLWLWVLRIDALLAPYDIAPVLSPCPVVLVVQNLNPYVGPRGSSVLSRLREDSMRLLTGLGAKRAGRVVFPSEYARCVVRSALSVPEWKTAVIPLGIPPEFFEVRRQSEYPVTGECGACSLLVVSSIRGHKDHITVLKAVSELTRRGFPLRVQFAGPILDAGYHKRLVRFACQAGIADKVSFLGSVGSDVLISLCSAATAFVFPSYVESFGLPVLEAMAAGIPCIASDIPVMRELCADGVLYYKPGDFADLAEKLGRLLTDSVTRSRLVGTATRRARQYHWTEHVSRVLALLEEVTTGGRKSET